MSYILSPEQKVVVDALMSKETSSTKYFDLVTAIQSISKGCTSALNDGKKILIHIPGEEIKNAVKNIFSSNGLDDLTIDISEKGPMPELDIIKLRSTLKKQKNTDAIINHVLSCKRETSHGHRMKEYYNAFDTKVMAETSFRDFITKAIFNKTNDSELIMVNSDIRLQLTASEYYNIKKEIKTASQIYHRQYDLYDHLSLFNEELWSDFGEAKITKVKSQLDRFKNESTQLANEFVVVINQLKEASTKELNHTFETLENKLLSHEEACISYQIKSTGEQKSSEGMFSIFKKNKSHSSNKIYVAAFDEISGLIQNISKEWYEELDTPTAEIIDYQYITQFINNNRKKSSLYKAQMSQNLQLEVQRINKINTSVKEVTDLDTKLAELIERMNASELFDIKLEHNILSFVKQVELSQNISDFIDKCYVLVNSSSSYLEWKSFFNTSSDIFRIVFESLKKLPKNLWTQLFECWYENQIQEHVLGQKTISSIDLDTYFNQAKSSNQHEVSSLIAKQHSTRIESAEVLRTSSKELHNTLFKKKQLPAVSWHDTALMNRPFMQSFFPIHIADSLSYSDEYDIVISFSRDERNPTSKIHYFSAIESKDIQNMAEQKHNFLYLNDYNYYSPLAQLSSTDKLKASKKLAKYILSLNQNIKIYQLKNANIISLLPAQDDAYLEHKLDNINAKVIDTQGVLYDRLTESILFTERKPYLILKDELINSELYDHILWQLKVIRLFKDVGYEILSLNTPDQIADNEKEYNRIIQKIKGSFPDPNEVSVTDTTNVQSIPEEV